jgi:hypothetical protein
MRAKLLIVILCCTILPQVAWSADPATNKGTSATKIENLINRLVATAAEPNKESRDCRPPATRICQAVDELHALGVEAFPHLIAHYDDERYCCCEDSLASDEVYHLTVGDVCRIILERQVRTFVPWKVADPRGTPDFSGSSAVPPNKKEAQAWWEANDKQALWQLQAAHVTRVIAANRKHLGQEQNIESRQKCEAAIEANEKLLQELTTKQTPVAKQPWRPYIGR